MKKPTRTNRIGWLSNLFLVIASLILAGLLGEAMLRIFLPQDLRFNVTQWDEFTGFELTPGISGTTRHREYTMLVSINSKGLRDREYPYKKPPRTIRIGVFGDSFTYGEGVQNNETYPSVIENLFNDNSVFNEQNWTVEVINFGIGNTGTSHQYALYIKEGHKYELDIIVLGFLGGNDFNDNTRGVFHLSNGTLVHDPAAYSSIRKIQKIVYQIPFYRWLAANSHLVNFAIYTATRIDDNFRRDDYKKKASGGDHTTKADLSKESYIITDKLVNVFREQVVEDGRKFIFMYLPTKIQSMPENYTELETEPVYLAQTEALFLMLGKKNFNVLNLVPEFTKLEAEELYFKIDGHMNSAGQKVVAAHLKNKLNPYIQKLVTPR